MAKRQNLRNVKLLYFTYSPKRRREIINLFSLDIFTVHPCKLNAIIIKYVKFTYCWVFFVCVFFVTKLIRTTLNRKTK